jgi:hypothetical protein
MTFLLLYGLSLASVLAIALIMNAQFPTSLQSGRIAEGTTKG